MGSLPTTCLYAAAALICVFICGRDMPFYLALGSLSCTQRKALRAPKTLRPVVLNCTLILYRNINTMKVASTGIGMDASNME